MIVSEIIKTLAASKAIFAVNAKNDLQELMANGGDPETLNQMLNQKYITNIMSRAEDLSNTYRFYLTSGGIPRAVPLRMPNRALILEVSRTGKVNIIHRDDPFNERPVTQFAIEPEYIKSVEINGTYLVILTAFNKVVIELPPSSVYDEGFGPPNV